MESVKIVGEAPAPRVSSLPPCGFDRVRSVGAGPVCANGYS